jgi:hypothetical protein
MSGIGQSILDFGFWILDWNGLQRHEKGAGARAAIRNPKSKSNIHTPRPNS